MSSDQSIPIDVFFDQVRTQITEQNGDASIKLLFLSFLAALEPKIAINNAIQPDGAGSTYITFRYCFADKTNRKQWIRLGFEIKRNELHIIFSTQTIARVPMSVERSQEDFDTLVDYVISTVDRLAKEL